MPVSGNENLVEYHENSLEFSRQEEEFAAEQQRIFGGADKDMVYIGDKPKKIINYNGRSFTFFRLAPSPVPTAVAAYLLGFKGVFSSVGEMKAELERSQQVKQHRELTGESQRLAAQQHRQQQEGRQRTTVRIGSGEIDLSKMTSARMRDLAEENGINPYLLPLAPADMRIYLIDHFKRQEKNL